MYQRDPEMIELFTNARVNIDKPEKDWCEFEFDVNWQYRRDKKGIRQQDVYIDISINAHVDDYLYHVLEWDVEPELTAALYYFIQHEWNGNVKGDYKSYYNRRNGDYSLAQFPAWYKFYVMQDKARRAVDYEEREEDEDRLRRDIIMERLKVSHAYPDLPTSQRIQEYLRTAIQRVETEEDPVFIVNGTSAHFWFSSSGETREEILHALGLLLDYACGYKGYKSPTPFTPTPFRSHWTDYLSAARSDRLRTIGYTLHVCDKRVGLMLDANKRMNEQGKRLVEDYLQNNTPVLQEERVLETEVHGHDIVNLRGNRRFIPFDIDGDEYAIAADHNLIEVEEAIPVISCNEDMLLQAMLPHGYADAYCRECCDSYEWEENTFYRLGDPDKWINVEQDFERAEEAYDQMWANLREQQVEVGPTLCMFADQPELYELTYSYPRPLEIVNWVKDKVSFDAERNILYCPNCHQPMIVSGGINLH